MDLHLTLTQSIARQCILHDSLRQSVGTKADATDDSSSSECYGLKITLHSIRNK